MGSGIVLPPVTGPMVLSHSRERPALPSCSHVHVRLGVRPWAKNPGLPGILSLHTHHLHLLAQPQLRRHAFPAGPHHRGAFQVNLGAARATVRPQSGEASERAGTPHGVPASRRGRLAAGASGTSGSRWEGGRPCGQPANRAAGGAEVSLSILPAPHPPYVPRPIAVGHLDWGMPSPTL